ncbi:hypothetical protein ACLOJK_019739 [Asimina triloba]
MEPITGGQRSSPSTDGNFTSRQRPCCIDPISSTAASFFRSGGTISIRPNPRSNVATPISLPVARHGRAKMQQIDRQLGENGNPASEQRPIESTITHRRITGHRPFKQHHKAFRPSIPFRMHQEDHPWPASADSSDGQQRGQVGSTTQLGSQLVANGKPNSNGRLTPFELPSH